MRQVAVFSALVMVGAMAVGCGPQVPKNERLVVRMEETTKMATIRMTVSVDGVNVFGPLATLKPGEVQTIVLNEPPTRVQNVGQHTLYYTFDRVGVIDAVGHASIQLLANDQIIAEDNSHKVLTGFAPTYSFPYVIVDRP